MKYVYFLGFLLGIYGCGPKIEISVGYGTGCCVSDSGPIGPEEAETAGTDLVCKEPVNVMHSNSLGMKPITKCIRKYGVDRNYKEAYRACEESGMRIPSLQEYNYLIRNMDVCEPDLNRNIAWYTWTSDCRSGDEYYIINHYGMLSDSSIHKTIGDLICVY